MKISNQHGFSFVELMIVVAIIGIMTAVGLVSLNSGKNQKQVETEARKVISIIREAQNSALSGKTVGSGYPCSFSVVLRPDGNQGEYSLEYSSKPGISDVCSGSAVSQELARYALDYGVVFPSGVEIPITFTIPFGSLSPLQDYPVTLSKGTDHDFTFCVCSSGKIVENGVCTGNC